MAQLVLSNIDDNVSRRLQARAAEHGRTVEDEVRAILNDAVGHGLEPTLSSGLGARIVKRFAGVGLDENEAAAMEMHREVVAPADFD